MTRVRVRGFKIWRQRKRRKDGSVWTSRVYCQHRATGRMVDLSKAPLGSAEFFAECEKIAAEAAALEERKARPGTLGGLIKHYREHEHFQNLAPRTQRDYQKLMDYLAPISDTPVHMLDLPLISGIHDRAAKRLGWKQANYLVILLRQVFKFARPMGLIDRNPAEGVIPKPRPRTAGYANRPWTLEEEEAMLASAPPALRVALAFMANTGLDPSDAIRVSRGALGERVVYGVRGKTGVEIAVPIGRRLQAALEAAPAHDAVTVLANSRGRPWSYNGLASAFRMVRVKLEAKGKVSPGLTMKGLRHTVATALRESGLDERSIADLLGQRTTSMAGHYSRSADLAAKNLRTVELLEDANERRTKVVKPFPKTVKPRKEGQE